MKHFYVGLGILVLCLALCTVSICILSRTAEQTTVLLEQAMELGNQRRFDEVEPLTDQAMALWSGHQGFFGIILRHDEADEVNATFEELQEYVRNSCVEKFEPTCARLIEQIRHIADMELPLYYNVLTAFGRKQ